MLLLGLSCAWGFLEAAEYEEWIELLEGAREGERVKTARKEAVRDEGFGVSSLWAVEEG